MIGKISKGASGRGLVRYLFGPGRANEHTDQRVIASGISLWAEEGRMLTPREIADLGAALDSANDAYGKNPAGGHIWHVSLSLAAGERLMTDEEWAEIAQVVMATMGFEKEGVASAAWVAIGHGVSAQGNQHIHVAGIDRSPRRDHGQDLAGSKDPLAGLCRDRAHLRPERRRGPRGQGDARVEPSRTRAHRTGAVGRTSADHPGPHGA